MKNGFEIYTNNGGGITLYIISNGKPVVAFPSLELLFNWEDGGNTFRSMIGQLCGDPIAYEEWDGAWKSSVEDLYKFDADPDRNHDVSNLSLIGEYDDGWGCAVTVFANPNSSVAALLGWFV